MTETKQFNPYYYNQGNVNWYWYLVRRAISDMRLYFEKHEKPRSKYYLKLIEIKDKILPKLQEWCEKIYYTLLSWNDSFKHFYHIRLRCAYVIKLKDFFHSLKCKIKTVKLRLIERKRKPKYLKVYYWVSR